LNREKREVLINQVPDFGCCFSKGGWESSGKTGLHTDLDGLHGGECNVSEEFSRCTGDLKKEGKSSIELKLKSLFIQQLSKKYNLTKYSDVL
jgi:hypothetical protein